MLLERDRGAAAVSKIDRNANKSLTDLKARFEMREMRVDFATEIPLDDTKISELFHQKPFVKFT